MCEVEAVGDVVVAHNDLRLAIIIAVVTAAVVISCRKRRGVHPYRYCRHSTRATIAVVVVVVTDIVSRG